MYNNACIGMQLSDIKEYINMAMPGDETIDERLQMVLHRKEETEQQIKELEKTLETINYKIWFYETAKEKGTTEGIACKCIDVPEKFRAVKRRISNFSQKIFQRINLPFFQIINLHKLWKYISQYDIIN